ncbi:MAG: heavy-metal-associated domain-containing protein [Gemmatimonadaceae bacterium]|nr:heavy-metal-associated domain-containing protein [Gemmatimonadaceae bacterium]
MKALDLKIDGMSCAHCVASVQKALEQTEGVAVKHVDVGRATVSYDPQRTGPDRILAAVADTGFTPHVQNG